MHNCAYVYLQMFSNLKSYLIDAAILDFVKVLLEEIIQVSKEPFKPIWCEVFSENQRRSSYPLSTEKKSQKLSIFFLLSAKGKSLKAIMLCTQPIVPET